jgi:hypothetical protein
MVLKEKESHSEHPPIIRVSSNQASTYQTVDGEDTVEILKSCASLMKVVTVDNVGDVVGNGDGFRVGRRVGAQLGLFVNVGTVLGIELGWPVGIQFRGSSLGATKISCTEIGMPCLSLKNA